MTRRTMLEAAAALALLAASVTLAVAQQTPAPAPASPPAAAPAARQAVAHRVTGRPPVLDGRLDDEAWASATVLTGFSQREPKENEAASEGTEVRFVFDDHALYVGARMQLANARALRADVSRRDVYNQAEMIAVSLDTYHDRRTAYTFGVTAAGTRIDYYHPADSPDGDESFSPVWEARVSRDSTGWTAEMRIPFSQLRFSPGSVQTWGVNVRRWVPQREEDDYWVVVPRSVSAYASRFGELTGISGVRPTRRMELSPYASAGASLRQGVDPADPFHDPRQATVRTGADLKMGLGPNLTLDATVNPDFGQVEADPAEVNLSAFETFFSEQRPFFTEGSQLLQATGAGYFYSRRIGAAPHGPAGGDFVDRPDASTILGAAKLTGRLPSGLSVGMLAAVTGRERARTFNVEADTFGRVVVEPPTGYAVARLQQELGKSGSTAGVIFTGVHRGLEGGTPLAARLPGDAFAGGADWNLRLHGGTYQLGGSLGFSRVSGDSLSILRLQRSSARYFQRPDGGSTLDPSRTVLSGVNASFNAAKISGAHWLWSVDGLARSPGFEVNDAGQMSTAGIYQAIGELRYRETKPGGPFRRWAVYATPVGQWTAEGVWQSGPQYLDFEGTWKNTWRTYLTAFYIPRGQSPTLTRGGPLAGSPASWAGIAQVTNSPSAPLRWRGRIYYGENETGQPTVRLSGGISARAGTRFNLSIDPNYLRTTPVRQYIASFGGGPAETFGRTYVFSAVKRNEFFADVRLNYLFTPDLSLQLWAEPFASSGRYHSFGVLPEARAFTLDYYGADTTHAVRHGSTTTVRYGSQTASVTDFNVRSFRSNAVLRWEWRRGSTLYLVWQQDREGDVDRIGNVGGRSLLETLDAPGDNFLALKVTYWLPVH